jgi:hypothetical protein
MYGEHLSCPSASAQDWQGTDSHLLALCASYSIDTHSLCLCVELCPKFREARTSAHNQVLQVIIFFLACIIGRKWLVSLDGNGKRLKKVQETCMKNTVLLSPVSAASLSQAQQRLVDYDSECLRSLDRWQPGWVFVSHELKRNAIFNLCLPSDVHTDQLKAAAICKQEGYKPLLSVLSHYIHQGWAVHIFPWVVGICGLIDPNYIASLLNFLDIPRKHKKAAVERTILASVKVLYFMHQVRFGSMHCRKRFTDNQRNICSDEEATDDEELQTDPFGKRRSRLAMAACS